MIIPLYLDRQFIDSRIEINLNWNYTLYSHLLVIGSTGSGKTVATQWALHNMVKYINNCQLWICDFKNDDYRDFEGLPRYYAYMSVVDGIKDFFTMLQKRQSGNDQRRNFCLLMVDEYSSLLNCLDKKQSEQVKAQIATILSIGRGFNCHLMITQQRGDSEFFSKARDNFSLILACGGNLSKESAHMFGFQLEEMLPCRRGQGYALFHGSSQMAFQVPHIKDFTKLKDEIKSALM